MELTTGKKSKAPRRSFETAPVRLGPDDLAELWGKVESGFHPSQGETVSTRETWVEGRAMTKRREWLHVDTMAEFVGDPLPGLLDEVEVWYEAELTGPGSGFPVRRSVRLRFWADERPEVSLDGEKEWVAAREQEFETFLVEKASDSRRKRLALGGIFFVGALLYLAKNTTSPFGEIVALLVSALFAGFVGGYAYLFSNRTFPMCRVFTDKRQLQDPWWYRYGVYVAGTILLGVAAYFLTPIF
jgi:hypothetical protein